MFALTQGEDWAATDAGYSPALDGVAVLHSRGGQPLAGGAPAVPRHDLVLDSSCALLDAYP
jgi:hypothetical protein